MSVGLNIREKLLLNKIQEFFDGKGKLYAYERLAPKRQICEWKIFKKSDMETIILHFNNYPLEGPKIKKYAIWKEIVFLTANKNYFLQENFTKIKSLIGEWKKLN